MKNKILLLLVLLLATFLRFYRLGEYPALNADEAALGYNAYSLLETGRDEHGNSWPIHFQSFNDYKPGLYVYMIMPFIKLLGLNEISVRLPNALLGVLTVFLTYQLGNLVNRNKKLDFWKLEFGILPAIMLSISPWHIHFSRGGWEVNTATFFMVLGLYLFCRGINNIVPLFLSSIAFGLSLYTYHAARITVPLLVIGILFVYRNEFKKNFKNFLLSGLVALVTILPLVNDFIRPEIMSRASGVGLLADSGPLNRINEQRGEHSQYYSVVTKTIHNKLVNYTLAFFDNWTEHYHGLFLFLSGDDIQRNKVPETGQMYLTDAFLLLVGLYWVVKNTNKLNRILLWWLIVAPVPAALTFQSPHALRSENMVIPLTVVSALGFGFFVKWLSRNVGNSKIKKAIFLAVFILMTGQFARYQHMYWVHMSKEYPYSSQYGVKELVNYIKNDGRQYNNIVVTTAYDQPYILFLFYQKYSPVDFQNDHVLTEKDRFGFSTVENYSNYVFKKIDWDSDKLVYSNSLIIGAPVEIPGETNITGKIYGTNGFEYFRIVTN